MKLLKFTATMRCANFRCIHNTDSVREPQLRLQIYEFVLLQLCQAVAALQPAGAIVVDESLTSGTAYWGASQSSPPFSQLTLTGGAIGQVRYSMLIGARLFYHMRVTEPFAVAGPTARCGLRGCVPRPSCRQSSSRWLGALYVSSSVDTSPRRIANHDSCLRERTPDSFCSVVPTSRTTTCLISTYAVLHSVHTTS